MFCSNCGSEVKKEEKFCSNCGKEIIIKEENQKDEIKKDKLPSLNRKTIYIIISVILVIIMGIIILGLNTENIEQVISNIIPPAINQEELIDILKNDNGGAGLYLQEESVKVGTIIDINYNNYNKMVSYNATYVNGNITLNAGGILLYNTSTKTSKILINGDTFGPIIYYFNNNNDTEKIKHIMKEIENHIAKYGEDIKGTMYTEEFKQVEINIAKKIGVILCRNIIKENIISKMGYNKDVTYLYKTDEIFIKYVAYNITEQEYCWNIPESLAKYYYNTSRSTYNNLVLVMGEPYKTVKRIAVYGEEKDEAKLIGKYTTLENAKKALGLQEINETDVIYTNDTVATTPKENNNVVVNDKKEETVTTSNANESSSQNTMQNTNEDINQSSNNNLEEEIKQNNNDSTIEDNTVRIDDIKVEGKTYTQLKQEIENKGLKVDVYETIEQVENADDRAGTEECSIDTEGYYKKGQTVIISRTIYKGNPTKFIFGVRTANIEYDKGLYFVLEKGTTIYDNGAQGLKVYFDDKLVATLSEKNYYQFEYTFNNEKKIHVKLVAPYAYEEQTSDPEKINYKKDVVLAEYNLELKDIISSVHQESYSHYLY